MTRSTFWFDYKSHSSVSVHFISFHFVSVLLELDFSFFFFFHFALLKLTLPLPMDFDGCDLWYKNPILFLHFISPQIWVFFFLFSIPFVCRVRNAHNIHRKFRNVWSKLNKYPVAWLSKEVLFFQNFFFYLIFVRLLHFILFHSIQLKWISLSKFLKMRWREKWFSNENASHGSIANVINDDEMKALLSK